MQSLPINWKSLALTKLMDNIVQSIDILFIYIYRFISAQGLLSLRVIPDGTWGTICSTRIDPRLAVCRPSVLTSLALQSFFFKSFQNETNFILLIFFSFFFSFTQLFSQLMTGSVQVHRSWCYWGHYMGCWTLNVGSTIYKARILLLYYPSSSH